MELIDREKLQSTIRNMVNLPNEVRAQVLGTISRAKAVDAKPVVHGRWEPLEYDGFADGNPVWDLWECSECQEEHSGDEDTLTPYCPNCGAKMDGGAGDAKRND